MFISVLFFSLCGASNITPGGLQRRTSGPPTVANSSFTSTPLSPPDNLELLKLRQENASLIASKSTLDGRLQQLQVGLDEKEQERLRHIDEIKKFIVEKSKLEEQMKRLQSDLLRAQQAAAGSNAGGMGGRALSTTSTASPPSSPTNDMVSKTQFELAQAQAQALAQRMEEMLRTVEGERDKLRVKAEELANQLEIPAVEQQKKEWQEKIADLGRLMLALEKIKPPPVPKLDLSMASRRESVVKQDSAFDGFNVSFNGSFNGSLTRVRRNTLFRGQSPNRRSSVMLPGTRSILSRTGSPKEQPLIDLMGYQAFDEGADGFPQLVDAEQWKQAYEELRRYLKTIKTSESSDDDFFEKDVVLPSVLTLAQPDTESIKKLKAELLAEATAKSQLEVTLDARQKEIRRLTAERNALLKITGLSGDDLTHATSGVTISKRLPLAVALDNLCALLKKDHKRVAKQSANGAWDIQKISSWC